VRVDRNRQIRNPGFPVVSESQCDQGSML
jgi:hypothetical protein